MGFKELKKEFEAAVNFDDLSANPEPACDVPRAPYNSEALFRFWLLRLLFEINGNLDSLAATYRELVKLQKDRMK